MAAGQRVVHERERQARIREVAEHVAVDVEDRRRLRHLAAPVAPLPRVGLHRHRDGGRRLHLGVAGLIEPRDHRREVARRLVHQEDVAQAGSARARDTHRVAAGRRARGDAGALVGDGQPQHAGRVVGDRRLRIPVAAIAVEEARLGGVGELLVDRRVLLHRDRFTIRRRTRQAAAVGDRERDRRAADERPGQVDEHAVLAADAQREQPSHAFADDAVHVQRFGQLEGERADRGGAHRQAHLGAALDLLAIGIDGRADRVVRDVVVGFVVLAELARAARLQALRRGVDGDVAAPRALEQRDVLGLAAGAHVGERAEAALGADFGEEVADRRDERPALAAQVGELDAERLADLLLEDGLGLAQARRRHRLLGQRAADVIVTIDRVIAEEGGADRRAQLGLAGEDAQLRLLHRRLWA